MLGFIDMMYQSICIDSFSITKKVNPHSIIPEYESITRKQKERNDKTKSLLDSFAIHREIKRWTGESSSSTKLLLRSLGSNALKLLRVPLLQQMTGHFSNMPGLLKNTFGLSLDLSSNSSELPVS